MKKNESGFSVVEVLIIIVVIGLVGAVGWFVYDRQNNKSDESITSTQQDSQQAEDTNQGSTTPVTLEKGTYKGDGENASGTFQAKGYVTVETEKEPENICSDTCEEHENVYFNVTAVENTEAKKFIDSKILVGCKENGAINYVSTSQDGSKITSYSHTADDSKKILASTSGNEVVLEFNQIKFTGAGSEAPACYTFVTTKLIN